MPATVAILAGGVTLYEACAIGVPAIAVALSRHQHLTVRGIARAGAAIEAGGAYGRYVVAGFSRPAAKIARLTERLLDDAAARRRIRAAGRRLVDGNGAFRVADRIRRLPAAASERIGHVA
jgi:spore coat polysaccharide biosynthesis predicted glycosyltransferase SpsG